MLAPTRLTAVLLATAALSGPSLVWTAAPAAAAPQTMGQRILAEAQRHAGKPYKWGAAGPAQFDCSGYTRYVLKRLGRSLPHNSEAQFKTLRRISPASKRPGDLVFTKRDGKIRHVGIFTSGTTMLASVQSGDVVRKQSFAGRDYLVARVQ